jgi:hypothetical protein
MAQFEQAQADKIAKTGKAPTPNAYIQLRHSAAPPKPAPPVVISCGPDDTGCNSSSSSGSGSTTSSHDPNALQGPAGKGVQGFFLPSGALSYTVDFENDGNGPAQDVTTSQQLDPNLDWSTFQLGSFGFGPVRVTVPNDLTQYQTTVHYKNPDGSSLDVLVDLEFNVQTGLLSVSFASLDPTTGQAPEAAFTGFLPPDNSSGVGEGFVQYTVRPKTGLSTGNTVGGQASVVFDTNPALDTNQVLNTADSGAPTSSVQALPASSPASFPVHWSGQDDAGGSGIASYNVYVSDNGGASTLWQQHVMQTSAMYTGGQQGHTYAFYSVAIDDVGNMQPTPATAQATTTVDTIAPSSTVAALPALSPGTFTVSWSGTDNTGGSGIASYDVFVSDNGGTPTLFQSATTLTSATFTGKDGHTYAFTSVAVDRAGNRQTMATTPQATTTVDAAPPTSSVSPLATVTATTSFPVSWSGSDGNGSGIRSYDVFVSVDGGPLAAWLTGTTQTSATYTGSFNHHYGFAVTATDNLGNHLAAPTSAQASTTLVSPQPAVTARLVTIKVHGKKQLVVQIFENGVQVRQVTSPFQKPAFGAIQVKVVGSNVVLTARKGKKLKTMTFPG